MRQQPKDKANKNHLQKRHAKNLTGHLTRAAELVLDNYIKGQERTDIDRRIKLLNFLIQDQWNRNKDR